MSGDQQDDYLIENKLIYSPSRMDFKLIGTNDHIELKPTLSQILLILIQKQGTILTQNEIMEFAWGEKYRQVSFNAFYQNILKLRKIFIQMGFENPIIKTVPRKGVLIDSDVAICKYKNEQPLHAIAITASDKKNSTLLKQWISLFNIFSVALTVWLCFMIVQTWSQGDDYFVDYKYFGKTDNNCHYYFNSDTRNYNRHLMFLEKNPAICPENKFAYITTYYSIDSISVLVCDHAISANLEKFCTSFFYPRYTTK